MPSQLSHGWNTTAPLIPKKYTFCKSRYQANHLYEKLTVPLIDECDPDSWDEQYYCTLGDYSARHEEKFMDPKSSDITIVCDGHVFPANRLFLQEVTDYFETALSGQWSESQTGIVELHGVDPLLVWGFLRWVYVFSIDMTLPDQLVKESPFDPLLYIAELHQLGGYLVCPLLQEQCEKSFKHMAHMLWVHAYDLVPFGVHPKNFSRLVLTICAVESEVHSLRGLRRFLTIPARLFHEAFFIEDPEWEKVCRIVHEGETGRRDPDYDWKLDVKEQSLGCEKRMFRPHRDTGLRRFMWATEAVKAKWKEAPPVWNVDGEESASNLPSDDWTTELKEKKGRPGYLKGTKASGRRRVNVRRRLKKIEMA